jgi:hypothetical protein
VRDENGLRAVFTENERRVGATARCLQWHWDSRCRRRRREQRYCGELACGGGGGQTVAGASTSRRDGTL